MWAAGICILAMTAVVAAIAATSPIVDTPGVFVPLRTVFCVGLLVVGAVIYQRGANTRLAALLLATSFGGALGGLTAVDSPGPFLIGRIISTLLVLLVEYVCLAYPTGRIDNRAARRLFTVSAAAFSTLLAANALLSRVHPVAGPLVRCSGTHCPANPVVALDVGASGGRALSLALAVVTGLSLAGLAAVTAQRASRISGLQRRSLAPLLAWTMLAALGYGFYIVARAIDEHAELLLPAAIAMAAVIAAMPFAIGLGLVRGRVFAIAGLQRMVVELGEHPSLAAVQRTMARVFDDPGLELFVWRPSERAYLDTRGNPVRVPALAGDRTVTEFTRGGMKVAVAVHDPILTSDILHTAGSVVGLALENSRLESDLSTSVKALEASRERLASAANEERRRIEQDLHDGAQQALIALQIKLHLLGEVAGTDPDAVVPGLADAERRVGAALNQIRDLAQGIYPSVLRDLGLSRALAPVVRELPIEVSLRSDVRSRFSPEVETAVYFCCVEALQNAAKHCGSSAHVRLLVSERPGCIEFSVQDDGPGFEPGLAERSRGIMGMRDRLEAVGGDLSVTSTRGRGTTIAGHVSVRRS